MIPGLSIRYVKGLLITLNPPKLLVIQGTAPTFAPDRLFFLMSSSCFLSALMIVDLPTLGIPPIIIQLPIDLNSGFNEVYIKVSRFSIS